MTRTITPEKFRMPEVGFVTQVKTRHAICRTAK